MTEDDVVENRDEQPSVLLVDDEPANLDAFRRVFRRQFRMLLCSAPNEALEALKTRAFDLVIADHAMPEMTGIELLLAAREVSPDTGRIIVTGYPDLPEVREAGHQNLVATVIMKPWKKDEITRWANHFHRVRAMIGRLGHAAEPGGGSALGSNGVRADGAAS